MPSLTNGSAKNLVRALLVAAGNPNPAIPGHRPAWDDVAWRGLAIIHSVNREPWPCWACWLATGTAYRCPHGTWWAAPRPVYRPR